VIRPNRKRGIALLVTAICLTFLIPMAGLVIDAGLMYGARARMSAATDAAAIAAARSLSTGQTVAQQQSTAEATARKFFAANFPPGTFLTKNAPTVNVLVTETALRIRTVRVDARADIDTMFMRYLSANPVAINVAGTASRRDVNLVMVLDRSGSMNSNGGCAALRSAAASFAQRFANYRDRVGMVSYSTDTTIDAPLQDTPGDFLTGPNGVPAKANALVCDGYTNTASALWRGYQEIARINEAGALNVIVLMTDGQPNTMAFNLGATNGGGQTAIKKTPPGQARKYGTESPCTRTDDKTGVVALGIEGLYKLQGSGRVPASQMAGCFARTDPSRLSEDLAFIPRRDLYGNELLAGGYRPVSTYSAGTPDSGEITLDRNSYVRAAFNAVNSAGMRIRANAETNSRLDTVIFALGFAGGVGAQETELLRRVANHPGSPAYDSSKPAGFYMYAPDAAALNQAFYMIAGEVLRISR
jgi:Flp pilus assembly protein TadG